MNERKVGVMREKKREAYERETGRTIGLGRRRQCNQ